MSLLKAESLQKKYTKDGPPAIQDVSFSINEGEVLVVFGESGSGKTTILKIIAGLLKADGGRILLEGEPVPGPDEKLVPGHEEIKLVFQDFNLKNKMSVRENISYALLTYEKAYQEERTELLLDLCGLRAFENYQPHELSGGQKQRVALARALANEPKLLLMDEPFSNLDSITKGILFREIREIIHQVKTSIVFVSHDARDALSFADKIAVIDQGKIQQIDSPKRIYVNPVNKKVAELFGELNKINNKFFRIDTFLVSDNGHAQLEGIVEEVLFLGEHQLLMVNIGVDEPLKVIDRNMSITKNQKVGIKYDPNGELKFSNSN